MALETAVAEEVSGSATSDDLLREDTTQETTQREETVEKPVVETAEKKPAVERPATETAKPAAEVEPQTTDEWRARIKEMQRQDRAKDAELRRLRQTRRTPAAAAAAKPFDRENFKRLVEEGKADEAIEMATTHATKPLTDKLGHMERRDQSAEAWSEIMNDLPFTKHGDYSGDFTKSVSDYAQTHRAELDKLPANLEVRFLAGQWALDLLKSMAGEFDPDAKVAEPAPANGKPVTEAPKSRADGVLKEGLRHTGGATDVGSDEVDDEGVPAAGTPLYEIYRVEQMGQKANPAYYEAKRERGAKQLPWA